MLISKSNGPDNKDFPGADILVGPFLLNDAKLRGNFAVFRWHGITGFQWFHSYTGTRDPSFFMARVDSQYIDPIQSLKP